MYTAHKMSDLNNNNNTTNDNNNNNITTNAAQQGSFVSYNWLSVSQHQPTTQAVTQPSSFALVQPSASQQSLQFNPNQQQQQQVQNYQDYSQSLPLNSNLEPQLSILLQQQQVLSNHLQQQLVGSTLQQQFQQQQQQSSQPLIAYNNYTTFCPLNNDTQASIDNKGQKDSINTTNNNNNNNNNSASNNLSCDFLEPNPINIMGNANVTVSQQLQRSITNTDNGGIRNININNKIGAVNNRLNPVSRRRNLPRNLNEREHFLIFVKILFKLLQSTVSPDHCRRAKSIVNECTRRNRLGEADYTPLQQAVTNRLRHVVGDTMWQQTHVYLDKYCRQHGLKIAPPMSAIVTAVV